jgi:hypothetical protein
VYKDGDKGSYGRQRLQSSQEVLVEAMNIPKDELTGLKDLEKTRTKLGSIPPLQDLVTWCGLRVNVGAVNTAPS